MTATVGQLRLKVGMPAPLTCACGHHALDHHGLSRDCETDGCGCRRYEDACARPTDLP